jgi:hypothetical protein
MKMRTAAVLWGLAAAALAVYAADAPPARPKAGKVEIMPLSEVKPGMKATAWTVFQGREAEPVPVEIIGRWRDQLGPRQDVILGRMGGKAAQTFVAGGMSGSPVYVDGKLIGAVSLRIGQFTPDAICGITPIEAMLEVNEFDKSRPDGARTPEKPGAGQRVAIPSGLLGEFVGAGGGASGFEQQPFMVPIETPLAFSGFTDDAMRQFAPAFQGMGIATVQGGAGADIHTNKPADGWERSLNPGEVVAGVLVDGDMSVTGLGTVTYNDGQRVLAFGHSLFDLGPVSIPMSKGEVLMTLASTYAPNKLANATEIVGTLHQDRHSAIMGRLGEESRMVPVSMKVRALDDEEKVTREKDFHFNVFVHEKWTAYLMMLTMYNSLSQMNEFADETTYRLSGKVEVDGQPSVSLATMEAAGVNATPAHLALANWWGERINRLYVNNVKPAEVKQVSLTVDLLPERRVLSIDNAWVADAEVRAGDDVLVKAMLRPYRGDAIVREFPVHIPAGLAKGDHRIVLSDADTANRMQSMAGQMDRFIEIPETVSLLNQERGNNKMYVSLVVSSPTAYYDDKTMPSLPASALNVMQSGRASNRSLVTSAETATEQMALPFDYLVTGSYSLRIHVN